MKPRLEFVVPGAPVPCARPRVVAVRGHGGRVVTDAKGNPVLRAFTPDETVEYESRVELVTKAAFSRAPAWRAAFDQKLPIRLHIHIVRQHWRGDWDNFAKGIVDGMANAQCVFFNDNRVTQALVSIHTDKKAEPRAEVLVETASATLEEPLWMRCAREAGWSPPAISVGGVGHPDQTRDHVASCSASK